MMDLISSALSKELLKLQTFLSNSYDLTLNISVNDVL